MRLEKFQRNAILRAIEAGGLDPVECDLTDDGTEVRLIHMPSGSRFVFTLDAGRWTGSYVVGDSSLSWPFEFFVWTTVPERVAVWAAAVKDDVDTPDLWAELQRERDFLTGARYEGVENTPFTADERAEVARQLQEIKEYVASTYSPTEDQILSFVARLAYVEEAAGRMAGRTGCCCSTERCSV